MNLTKNQHQNQLTIVGLCGNILAETTQNKMFCRIQGGEKMQNEYEIKKEMCEIGRRVYNRGMVAANDGNFSVKLNDHEFLCTPTGVSKGFMNQKRPDVKSVVHAHPLYATTFAIAGIPLTQPIMPEAVIALGCVPITPYGTPGTMEIPDAVEPYLEHFDAVLLENHGALTYSDSLLAAYMKMESVEFYAQLLWQTMQVGGPQEFSPEQVETLYEVRRKMGLPGKHPANLCPNAKAGKPSCHTCGGSCAAKAAPAAEGTDADLIASITKKVMEQLGM